MSRYCLVYLAILMVGSAESFSSQTRVTSGGLLICPDSPNCVSSQSDDPRHAITPFLYEGEAEKANAMWIKTVLGMKRSRIVISEELYLHAERDISLKDPLGASPEKKEECLRRGFTLT